MMLNDLTGLLHGKRAVILGVGNPLQGDDGVGPRLVDLLQGRIDATLIDGGQVPENYMNSIQAAQPDVVLIIVALELGAEPGCMVLLDVDRLRAIENFTRNPGLAFLALMIQDGTGAEVILVGIQPESTAFASELSQPVQQTLLNLEVMIADAY
ncbi:MAG: hydrogenase maturation protease [Anaerolineales bacterium]